MSTTDVIRGLPDDPDLSVEITTGTEHFRHGAIALTVRGDGAVSVQQRRSGDEREYRGRLDADRLRRLADELFDAQHASLQREFRNIEQALGA